MAWYDEAIFYHIYPLGLSGAPAQNEKGEIVHRLRDMENWIDHIKAIGCNALYIGPLFESVGHGYETTDYKTLDRRLGDNEDLKHFVASCHKKNVKVIFDGVFNHTGRDFFAFLDVKEHRENSRYKDWYCNVNFGGNNEYNDGFSYDNWGGYNLLVKLNQRNPEVRDYIYDVIRFWVSEFDVDGIRLDAADVLDFDFMKGMRRVAEEVKPDFWLMGEVIHGEYNRWVNTDTLHSVTNYHLNKALWSGCNDHNFFEIAHTVKRLYDMGGGHYENFKLYNFADNHDVERIASILSSKEHFDVVHILMYTLPGIPSIYYGSEFAIEGKKERGSDASLRPSLNLSDYENAIEENPATALIAKLGQIRQNTPALSYGEYKELLLMNRQYAYSRSYQGTDVIAVVNNDEQEAVLRIPYSGSQTSFTGSLTQKTYTVENGQIEVVLPAYGGDILV
ncbi:MAG: alpha-glucosidase C-terminal domain-containing protein [Lachnospiraceae bacterium]|nr:alpha-glucosidase C-terminal domain-containing protein [Lachnospiraceae bacterium]